MSGINIAGYTYYPTQKEAEEKVKSKDDIVTFEAGLGYYIYSNRGYKNGKKENN